MLIGIIGVGFVGNAIHKSFIKNKIDTVVYDKYKQIGSFESVLKTEIIFLCLPTNLKNNKILDKTEIVKTCNELNLNNFEGLIVIKSTIEPTTTDFLAKNFPDLNFIHNPEFLTARTAEDDFHKQSHIVLGKSESCPEQYLNILKNFYNKYYPNAKISVCSSIESESMKIFCNSFYSVKVQFFNELYDFCQKINIDYEKVKELMLKNNWINPMHTNVPGHDGKISYGGMCLPKDSEALLNCMKDFKSAHSILEASIKERNLMRNKENKLQNENNYTSDSNIVWGVHEIT